MTAPSHRSFDTAVPLEAPQDLVGFEASHSLAAIAVRRRLPFGLVLSFVFVAFLIAASIAPSLFTHFDPLVGDFSEGLKPPGWAHLFGTDRLGRDVFARTVFGTHYSLLIGFGGVAVGLGSGIVLGIIAGQRNRILDEAVSRLFDMLSSFPGVLLAMLIVTFLGQGMLNIAIAVGIAGIPKFGRVVRAQTQLIRDADYVTQAAIYGLSRCQVFIRHVLPNVLVAIPIIATVYIGSTILIVSGLSFLGLGPQPPTPEWGVMLAESRDVLRVAWWPGVFPGLAITATVIAFSVIGNHLQQRFEGRLA
ncbi:peptide/nickel transport system permease protein [Bradyrhizobium sp. RT9b]|uniref:ABC transporter permease n=1 Tax=Bradyrhizobium sp. RT9b TaxID=3156385 RepID=UPI0033993675